MNLRPPVPQTGALTRLRYAPKRPLCQARSCGSTAKPRLRSPDQLFQAFHVHRQPCRRTDARPPIDATAAYTPSPSCRSRTDGGVSPASGAASHVARTRLPSTECIADAEDAEPRQQPADAAAVSLGERLEPHPCLQKASAAFGGQRLGGSVPHPPPRYVRDVFRRRARGACARCRRRCCRVAPAR